MGCLWSLASEGHWVKDALPTNSLALTSLGIHLVTFGLGADRVTALFVRPGVAAWVSGQPVLGGLRVLQHQDEIVVGGQRIFYSSESKPEMAAFRAKTDARPTKCAVCRVIFKDEDRIVECPQCGRLYHQSDADGDPQAKQCWTYRAQCLCNHPTLLSGDAWQPEAEDAVDVH